MQILVSLSNSDIQYTMTLCHFSKSSLLKIKFGKPKDSVCWRINVSLCPEICSVSTSVSKFNFYSFVKFLTFLKHPICSISRLSLRNLRMNSAVHFHTLCSAESSCAKKMSLWYLIRAIKCYRLLQLTTKKAFARLNGKLIVKGSFLKKISTVCAARHTLIFLI